MKFLIYTKNETRKNLLLNFLSEGTKTTEIQFEFINKLTALADAIKKNEFNIAGGIFDFDEESYKDLDMFIENLKNLNSKITILSSSPYKLTTLSCFSVEKSNSFECMLLSASNFAFRCNNIPCYNYKLTVENGECYLNEFLGSFDESTSKIKVLSYDGQTLKLNVPLTLRFSKSFDSLTVVKRMFNTRSNITNIFGEVDKIILCDITEKEYSFYPFQSIEEMKDSYIKTSVGVQ